MNSIDQLISERPDLFKRFDETFHSEASRMIEVLKGDFPGCQFKPLRQYAALLIIGPSGEKMPLAVRTMEPLIQERNDWWIDRARKAKAQLLG